MQPHFRQLHLYVSNIILAFLGRLLNLTACNRRNLNYHSLCNIDYYAAIADAKNVIKDKH